MTPRLVAAFAQARHDVSAWQPLCDALAAEFDGLGSIMLPVARAQRFPGVCASECMRGAVAQYMDERWHERDLRERALRIGRERGYMLDSDIGTREELDKEPYYRDLIRKNGIGGFFGILFDVGGSEWLASVQLPLDRFVPTDAQLALVPALSEALSDAANAIAAEVDAHWSASFEAFGALNKGVVLLDSGGAISRKNRVADAMLAQCRSARSGFVFPDPCTMRHFAALCAAPPDSPHRPLPYVISGAKKGSIVATIEREPEPLRLFLTGNVMVMTLSRHNGLQDETAAALHGEFDLQPSEIRIVLSLCQGRMIKEIAESLGIKEGTVRQRLKTVFSKTGTHSQHQLVARVLHLRAGNPFHPER